MQSILQLICDLWPPQQKMKYRTSELCKWRTLNLSVPSEEPFDIFEQSLIKKKQWLILIIKYSCDIDVEKNLHCLQHQPLKIYFTLFLQCQLEIAFTVKVQQPSLDDSDWMSLVFRLPLLENKCCYFLLTWLDSLIVPVLWCSPCNCSNSLIE